MDYLMDISALQNVLKSLRDAFENSELPLKLTLLTWMKFPANSKTQ